MDTVYWMDMRARIGNSLENKFRRLLKKLDFGSVVGNGELVAVKVHVGERGNLAYINHNYARMVAEEIKTCTGRPFLTDTNTLYSGGRHNAVAHFETAAMHGYSAGTTGAPFIVADGLRGLDYEDLPVTGTRFKTARVAGAICQADRLVVLSHFKGHCEMGFGGTIKNMGMGCAAVPGKLELHSGSTPLQNPEKCVACGQCVRRCPEKAIAMKNKKAVIDAARCIGCGQCVAACNYAAMQVNWESHGDALLEKVAEYAAAIHARFSGKAVYINFATDVSPDCDCWDYNDAPIVQDVGILASRNPLALDMAALDMVSRSPVIPGGALPSGSSGKGNVFEALRPEVKSSYLFEYCKKLGMDNTYELVKVD